MTDHEFVAWATLQACAHDPRQCAAMEIQETEPTDGLKRTAYLRAKMLNVKTPASWKQGRLVHGELERPVLVWEIYRIEEFRA